MKKPVFIFLCFLIVLLTVSCGVPKNDTPQTDSINIVNQYNTLETSENLCIDYSKFPLFSGYWGKNHIQGIAVDKENGYIYYSFTTMLIKCRLNGEFIGSVVGLMGHLGCIAFNEEDNCIYGTLEYKSDSVGTDIRNSIGNDITPEDAFYVAVFDTSKITKSDMDATSTGVMTTVYLKDVIDDYHGFGIDKNGNTVDHKYGCSGVDGITFGPMPGSNDDRQYLFVAY